MQWPWADIISNLCAVLALLISLYSFHRESLLEKRGREFDLFQGVYQEYLVAKIPEARSKLIVTQSGTIQGIDQFTSALTELRKLSLYFRFSDPDFFEELKTTMWKLEDYLVMAPEALPENSRHQFEHEVDTRLNNIYKCFMKKLYH